MFRYVWHKAIFLKKAKANKQKLRIRLIKGQSSISPEMAVRLSKCLGRSPESWLLMQDSYDLWQAKQKIDLSKIEPIAIPA
jgi:plasmid maintenance system antidote protein VapI